VAVALVALCSCRNGSSDGVAGRSLMVPLRWKEAELVQEMRMHQEKGFFYQYLLIFQDNPKKSLKKKKKSTDLD